MGEERLVSRRAAVGGALVLGASALVVGGLEAPKQLAHAQEEPAVAEGADPNAQYGFLFKVKNCVDCGECVKACRLWSRTPESAEARRKVVPYTASDGKEVFVSTSCMHCAVPSCASVCPAGAISKGVGGIVTVDKDRCIGCKYCYQACPYEVPRYDSVAMDKCDCCLGAGVPAGGTPHCVRACKFDALRYGPLDELLASTDGAALLIAEPNNPSCLVLGTRG